MSERHETVGERSHMGTVLFCAESRVMADPTIAGLPEGGLAAHPWVEPCADAEAARARMGRQGEPLDEAWVLSSDQMSAVNLAAALRHDAPALPIYLVTTEASGSMASRAQAAGVTGLLSPEGLARRLAQESRRRVAAAAREAALRAASAPGGPLEPAAPVSAPLPWQEALACETAQVVREACPPAPPAPARPSEGRVQVVVRPPAANPSVPAQQAAADQPPAAQVASGLVLSVVSGSGGAGRSTVAALVALHAAARGLRVALLDCDLPFGDEAALLGRADAPAADEVLSDAARWADADAGTGLAVIAAPRRLEVAEDLIPRIPQLIEQAAARYDVVVVNTAASWSEGHALIIERSARTLFLIDQRASSVRACRHALELCGRCGIATGSFVFLLNRCAKGASLTSLDVSCALQGLPVGELRDGGAEVEELMGSGMAPALASTRNDLVASVASAVDELLPAAASRRGVPPQPAPGRPGVQAAEEPRRGLLRRRSRRAQAGEGVLP